MSQSVKYLQKLLFITIISIVSMKANSQASPVFDKVKTAEGDVEMHFIGHGSLMFKVNGTVVHVDPVSASGNYNFLPQADIILITHEHPDHLDAALIGKLKKQGTLVFCNQNSSKTIGWAMVMKPGDRQEVKNIVIEAIDAYNIVNERAPGSPFHPKGQGLGYILTIGGKRFYVAGDTENTPEMKALKNIDVAFLPMNLPYTMTPQMVADAANAFKPKLLYPYHYGQTNTDELIKLMEGSGTEVRIRELK
ncbi:MAG TPA: MBL fold metallo-hydrolase [Bacteroidales bacterium]|nr:MBL fold metallo-hydrolase [Bacteroidales bacterium]